MGKSYASQYANFGSLLDRQLYEKYYLTNEEITFIENRIKSI